MAISSKRVLTNEFIISLVNLGSLTDEEREDILDMELNMTVGEILQAYANFVNCFLATYRFLRLKEPTFVNGEISGKKMNITRPSIYKDMFNGTIREFFDMFSSSEYSRNIFLLENFSKKTGDTFSGTPIRPGIFWAR